VAGGLLFLRPERLGIPPLVLAGYLLILLGNFVQVLCIYILGAYVGRTYIEAKGRPSYVVMETIGEEGEPLDADEASRVARQRDHER
jgi:hypothetical protein